MKKEIIKSEQYIIAVLEKALLVIEHLVQYPQGIALKDLAAETRLNKSTLFRILYTLQVNGYVAPPHKDGIYRLNYKFLSLFSSFPDENLTSLANRFLPVLANAAQKQPFFYIHDGNYAVCIAKYDILLKGPIRIQLNIGQRAFLHCTSGGKIFLAAMTHQEFEEWLDQAELVRQTPHTITDPAMLREEIARVRHLGYSVNNEENEDNVISVAAPIRNRTGKVIASVNVSETLFEFKPETIPDVAKIVIFYANQMSEALGYHKSEA